MLEPNITIDMDGKNCVQIPTEKAVKVTSANSRNGAGVFILKGQDSTLPTSYVNLTGFGFDGHEIRVNILASGNRLMVTNMGDQAPFTVFHPDNGTNGQTLSCKTAETHYLTARPFVITFDTFDPPTQTFQKVTIEIVPLPAEAAIIIRYTMVFIPNPPKASIPNAVRA